MLWRVGCADGSHFPCGLAWRGRAQTAQAVLLTSRRLGVRTLLQRYPTTALGASEVNLLELATVYRTIASGILAQPYVIREIATESGGVLSGGRQPQLPLAADDGALVLIPEGLRGCVRIPTGTAHALAASSCPIPVMGKTGTTNECKDALCVGSTCGVRGITIAVRIGFDDGRSRGSGETGGRVALPIFRDVMLKIYGDAIAGPVPAFPAEMEARITRYVLGDRADHVGRASTVRIGR